MSEAIVNILNKMIKFMATTGGRDKLCKLIQYLSIYLQFSKVGTAPENTLQALKNLDLPLNKVNYNMWITRKLLRFGLLWHYAKQIRGYINSDHNDGEQGDFKNSRGIPKKDSKNGSSADKGSEASSSFSIFEFDSPALKALSIICNALF